MARLLTPHDSYALMNLLQAECIGADNAITCVDSSTFISAGEAVLASGMDNVINSLYLLVGRLYCASREYKGKLSIVEAISTGAYSHRMAKISTYSKKALPSGNWNTDLFTNLAPGFTAGENKDGNGDPQSTKSQWEQNPPVNLEVNFGGSNVYDFSITMYEDQLKASFRNETEFANYISSVLTELNNDLEQYKEHKCRMLILNRIGADYDMVSLRPGSVVNLTTAFNNEFGTSYTSEELRTTHLKDFLAFMVARFKIDSEYMTERSLLYHWSPTKTVNGVDYELLRHTPYDKQKLVLFSPLYTKAEAYVMPTLFNPGRLTIDNFEPINYWQNINYPSSIDVIPAINDSDFKQVAGDEVKLDYVVGMIYDTDSMMLDYQVEYARSTPVEARKGFRNIWYGVSFNGISDPTEKSILYYMSDEDVVTTNIKLSTNAVTGVEGEDITVTYTGTLPEGYTIAGASSDTDVITRVDTSTPGSIVLYVNGAGQCIANVIILDEDNNPVNAYAIAVTIEEAPGEG